MSQGRSAWARYRGRPVDVRPGESLAAWWERRGVGIVQRSIRYHRPRAPFCGIGHCTNCLVRVNGRPNVRACRYRPAPGDRIETENAWPSPTFDVLGALDPIFARGLDTLHGFTRPAFARPLYHRVVRGLAGFGSIADAPSPLRPGLRFEADHLVLGAGTSGRAAVERLASGGGTGLWLDRGEIPTAPGGFRTLPRTTALFLPPPTGPVERPFRLLAATEDQVGVEIRARDVVVAVGGYDASLLFPGNDRPGVLTGDGALSLAPDPTAPGFRRAILVGGGGRAARLLATFGERIDAVVAPGPVGPEVSRLASERGVPIYPRTLILEALGRRRVRAVRLASRSNGIPFDVPGDAVILAHRRLPNPQLLFQSGASMAWRAASAAYYPTRLNGVATSVPGLFAVGEAGGYDPDRAASSGRTAGASILDPEAPVEVEPPTPSADGPSELEGYYRELLPRLTGRGKSIACPCEDILLAEIVEANRRGYRGIEVIKRYTGVGTGLCQGRYCLPDALLLLSLLEGRPPPEVGYITQRPPVVPANLGALAGLAADPTPEGP